MTATIEATTHAATTAQAAEQWETSVGKNKTGFVFTYKQDLASGNMRMLTHGSLDESPSFAPNGMSVIYAGRNAGRAALATVAIDGQVSQRLKSDRGDVREPVWGPFSGQ